MTLPVRPPLEPMLAKLTREVPDRDDCLYEPKWDGFRCLVFRDGDDLDLQSRNSKPLLRYFPELREPLLAQLPERCVLDGELVVVGARGLDFDALQLRQHPAESRVRKLAAEIPATFVAFDVLAVGDESLLDTAFAERRARLEALLAGATPPVVLTPATRDPAVARDWFARFEGAGFDGIIGKPLGGSYRPGERTLLKVKHERTADCAVGGYRVHKDGNGVGSLLLGLYDDGGALHHVGVAAGINGRLRATLLEQLQPYRERALENHPWGDWAEAMAQQDPNAPGGASAGERGSDAPGGASAGERGSDAPGGASAGERGWKRMPGGTSRWNADKDLSWEPLRVELVAEVAYEGLLGGRFRHNARFRHLRDDRDPRSCTYAQLEVVAPAELAHLFAV